MCQGAAPPGAKVSITASPKAADLIFKAVEKVVDENAHTETVNYFAKQNAASQRLVDEIDRAFDVMVDSLVKQVEKVLAGSEAEDASEAETHQ